MAAMVVISIRAGRDVGLVQGIPHNLPKYPSEVFCDRRMDDLHWRGISKAIFPKVSLWIGSECGPCRTVNSQKSRIRAEVSTWEIAFLHRLETPLSARQPGPIPNQSVQAPNSKHDRCATAHSFKYLPNQPDVVEVHRSSATGGRRSILCPDTDSHRIDVC